MPTPAERWLSRCSLLLLTSLLLLGQLGRGPLVQAGAVVSGEPYGGASVAGAAKGVGEPPPRHALFFSLAFHGHLRPLVTQAYHLSRRPGWTVSIASQPEGALIVQQQMAEEGWTGLTFIDLGECNDSSWQLTKQLAYSDSTARSQSWLDGLLVLVDIINHAHVCVYTPLHDLLTSMPTPPAIVVSDLVSAHASEDVLRDFPHIPHVLNNADLLCLLSPHLQWPAADWLPFVGSGHRLARTAWGSLPTRALMPPLRLVGRFLLQLQVDVGFNAYRSLSGLSPVSFEQHFDRRVVLVDNAFPLEYNRHVGTQLQLVGPQLLMEPVHAARQRYIARLQDSERRWMEAPLRGEAGWAVVLYASMGTIVPQSAAQVNAFMSAFVQLVTRHRHLRVLWKLRAEHASLVNTTLFPASLLSSLSHQLLVSPRVSSQLGVLSHPRTRLFLSHCGINSAYESIYLHVPVLCYPVAGDQADMAVRVTDSGAGDWLDSKAFDEAEHGLDAALVERIEAMLDLREGGVVEPRYPGLQRRARVVGDLIRLSGGVQRAVDLIEAVAMYGDADFLPAHLGWPMWAKMDWDVMVVWVAVSALLVVLVVLLVRSVESCISGYRRSPAKVHVA